MKRILIIAGEYPPYSTPCSFRMQSFVKYLPEFGYTPVVFSAIPDQDVKRKGSYFTEGAIDYEYEDICETYRFRLYPKVNIPSVRAELALDYGWQYCPRQYFKKAQELHKQKAFDLILITHPHPPGIKGLCLSAAARLSKDWKIPMFIDFRDLECQFADKVPHYKAGKLKNAIVEMVWKIRHKNLLRYEFKYAQQAHGCLTVSDRLNEMLKARTTTPVETIINGYEPDDYASTTPVLSDKFRIIYTGALHWGRDPVPLFRALEIIKKNYPEKFENLEVLFYGVTTDNVEALLGTNDFENVSFLPRISKPEIRAITKGADILLHLSHKGSKGIMTSKLTEYLGAEKPILTVPGDGDCVDAFLKETKAGVSLEDPEEIANHIVSCMDKKEKGVPCLNRIDPALKEKYSRRCQCKRLAGFMKSLTEF